MSNFLKKLEETNKQKRIYIKFIKSVIEQNKKIDEDDEMVDEEEKDQIQE